MPLIYITGVAGSGKSTVLNELKNFGYITYEADENISSWEHKVTRKRISKSNHKLTTDPQFFNEHDWYIDKNEVNKIAQTAKYQTVFICGSVANEDEVWGYFDKVFCLYIDDKTLKQRIMSRTDKDFGKSKHELNHLLQLNDNIYRKYTALGAVIIDSNKPPKEIANKIIQSLAS